MEIGLRDGGLNNRLLSITGFVISQLLQRTQKLDPCNYQDFTLFHWHDSWSMDEIYVPCSWELDMVRRRLGAGMLSCSSLIEAMPCRAMSVL